jgi:hypothetical protein
LDLAVVEAFRERDIPRLRSLFHAESYLDPQEALADVQ